ncbi:MAG: hypothetical protein L0212_03860 [Acidobacteria bacterium]|nr:hypothetical protein [Acidobacteriota bacterium]
MKRLRRQPVDFAQIGRFLASARKKLVAARKTLQIDTEACYQLAYEAMLKASLGFMLSSGVRPRNLPGHHVAIIQFAGEKLGDKFSGLIALFDRMRRKRHQTIYDVTVISRLEAEQGLATAAEYLQVIRGAIQEKNPRARLDFD